MDAICRIPSTEFSTELPGVLQVPLRRRPSGDHPPDRNQRGDPSLAVPGAERQGEGNGVQPASGQPGDIVAPIFTNQMSFTGRSSSEWVQIELVGYSVAVETYTMAHRAATSRSQGQPFPSYFMRNWTLWGTRDQIEWTPLSVHAKDQTLCVDRPFAGFTASNRNPESYSTFMIRMDAPGNSEKTTALVLSCFELYGHLFVNTQPSSDLTTARKAVPGRYPGFRYVISSNKTSSCEYFISSSKTSSCESSLHLSHPLCPPPWPFDTVQAKNPCRGWAAGEKRLTVAGRCPQRPETRARTGKGQRRRAQSDRSLT